MSKFVDQSFKNNLRESNDMVVFQKNQLVNKDVFKENYNSNLKDNIQSNKEISNKVSTNPNPKNNNTYVKKGSQEYESYDSEENINKKKALNIESETYNRRVITNKFFQNNVPQKSNIRSNSQEMIENVNNVKSSGQDKSKMRTLDENVTNSTKFSQNNIISKSILYLFQVPK